ncbi:MULTISPECIES: 3'-5' exonuclease [Sinorhizobium]|uniref:3'-5' exonuclease n=1 Tax=Sinorhizobium TaxID=28105 RepID=UPI000B49BF24|nr:MULTISPECIES: 3'-5' exonuclease [Sinorhizobium]ASP93347.1 3'-5' exonuclease [Sinorhizobium meliloti]MQX59915.1 3'-5' exonuclease [Sinorhizobium meliloti]RVJ74153.1 3'-5' exonuclease [Sinorhizobium medicae]
MSWEKVWVVDVEGNGATPPEIIEIALLELIDLEPTGRAFHWLIKPNESISAAVTRIHGLTDADVAGAPTIDDVAEDILTWTDGGVIVGHNVRVELEAISRLIPEWQPLAAIDTLKLARSLRPGLESYGLEKLGSALGLTAEAERQTGLKHHSAEFDVVLTGLLFSSLLRPLDIDSRTARVRDADILFNAQESFL